MGQGHKINNAILHIVMYFSLSARILYRAPPPPAPSGPKFSISENCWGSEKSMPPNSFGIWRVTEAILCPITCFFQKNIF